jgi:pimeloyl-ACP methyl ester carboxylesterase
MTAYSFIVIPGWYVQAHGTNEKLFKEKFAQFFPGSTVTYRHIFYGPFSFKKTQKYAEDILQQYQHEPNEIVLIGQSFGVFLGRYLITRGLPVKYLVQYGFPLYLSWFAWITFGKNLFDRKVPTLSIYGKRDALAPKFLSRFDKSEEVRIVEGSHFSLVKGENFNEVLPVISNFLINISSKL